MRHAQGRAGECHIVARTAKQDKVRELQRTLYRAAKADPGRRFHALYDKVYRRDVLERAWELVRANRGAAGIDRQTIADVEQYGVAKLLDELAADLKDGQLASASGPPGVHPEARQTAGASAAVDPGGSRSCRSGGREDGDRADLRGRHARVLVRVSARALGSTTRSRSSLMRRGGAGDGSLSRTSPTVLRRSRTRVDGGGRGADQRSSSPQAAARDAARGSDAGRGGRAQRYRHSAGRGDLALSVQRLSAPARPAVGRRAGSGVLVRYADDLLAMCHTRQEAERGACGALGDPGRVGARAQGRQDADRAPGGGGRGPRLPRLSSPLGARRHAASRHLRFLARWPSRQAMQHARDRIREITARRRLLLPVEEVVQDLNRFLRGWAGYFRYGNSARQFDKIDHYAIDRLARFVAKRHKRDPGYGWKVVPTSRRTASG